MGLRQIMVNYRNTGNREQGRKNAGTLQVGGFSGTMVLPFILFCNRVSESNSRNSVFLGVMLGMGVLLPIVIGMAEMTNHPARLPKVMYLLPMNTEERRRCIRQLYLFRVSACMLLSVIGVGAAAAVPVSYFDLFSIVLLLVNHLLMYTLVIPPDFQENKPGFGFIFAQAFIAFVAVVFVMAIAADENPDYGIKIFLAAVFVCIQLPIALKNFKNTKKILEDAIFFEGNQAQG